MATLINNRASGNHSNGFVNQAVPSRYSKRLEDMRQPDEGRGLVHVTDCLLSKTLSGCQVHVTSYEDTKEEPDE